MEHFTEDEKRLIVIAQDQYISEDEIAELSPNRLLSLIAKFAALLDTTPESEYEKAKREYDAFVKRVRGRNAS